MFGLLEDAFELVTDVVDGLVHGELPDTTTLLRFVEAGYSLYQISEFTGIGIDVLQGMINEA